MRVESIGSKFMKIIIARKAGFCMGVKRALEMVLDRAREEEGGIITYGPLIHNPQVVELLTSKNISSSRRLDKFEFSKLCFISAHGTSPKIKERLRSTGSVLCDASCPDVLKVQSIIKKHALQGYATVIFGDRGHTEVEGLLGFTWGRGYVVNGTKEVGKLPFLDKVCLVSQTTQDGREYHRVAEAVRKRFPEAKVFPTICPSTRQRQEEVRAMAEKVDAMIVVGGKNSANTARLSAIASRRALVFQVETAEDLPLEKIGDRKIIGVTAGASTPNWLIQGVVDQLRDWSWKKKPPPLRWLYRLFALTLKANLFIAFGGACLAFAAMTLLRIPYHWEPIILSFSVILLIYNLNIFADQTAIMLNQPSRYNFFQKYRLPLCALNLAALAGAIFCALRLGTTSFILTICTLLFGLAYSVQILPSTFSGRKLKNLTGVKELFSSLGWGVLTVVIPALSTRAAPPDPISIAVVFCFVSIIMFIRSALFALRDIQGDRLVGRETIAVVLGSRRTRLLMSVLTAILILVMIAAEIAGFVPPRAFCYLAVVIISGLFLLLYSRKILVGGLFQEMLVDSQLLLAGLIAFLVGKA